MSETRQKADSLLCRSAQRTRFQLRHPSDSEGGVCCKPSWAAAEVTLSGPTFRSTVPAQASRQTFACGDSGPEAGDDFAYRALHRTREKRAHVLREPRASELARDFVECFPRCKEGE
jgi:hypothetical protein